MAQPKPASASAVAIVISIVAILFAALAYFRTPQSAPQAEEKSSLLQRLNTQNVLRVGYGVFPPFTMEDPRTHRVSGVSVDIVETMARQVGARVEWRRLNWNTMSASLANGEFDMIADPIFLTPQRAREFSFTEPYAYFGIGIGVVRHDETRFRVLADINNPSITVAVGQGTGEEAFLRARTPRASIMAVPMGQDTATPMNAVLTGRADIAIANTEDATRVVNAHPANLKLLWADNPPAYVPAGFAVRMGDRGGVDFLNASLRNFRATGILQAIADRNRASIITQEPRPGN